MKRLILNILLAGFLILALDFFGWLMWAMSGQHPLDSWYVGTITGHIIKLFY